MGQESSQEDILTEFIKLSEQKEKLYKLILVITKIVEYI